jgi:hypothetical protein
MIKYFCNTCGAELTINEINYCNEMIGHGMFCHKHMPNDEPKMWTKKNDWKGDSDKPYPFKHPIICPCCGKDSGYTKEGIMFLVVQSDILCQHCGHVIIQPDITIV